VPTRAISLCRFCHAGCPIEVTLEKGRAIRVIGDNSNDLYAGYTCAKGRALPEQHNHPERLLHSQKRMPDGSYRAIPVDDAIGEIAEKLSRIVAEHGPRAVASYTGTFSLPYPATIPVAMALMDAIGSPMRFTSATIDQPGKMIAAALHGAWLGGAQTFDSADTWLLVGANPEVSKSIGIPSSNPSLHLHAALSRGLKLIIIDPRVSEAARKAAVHLQPRAGEDPTMLAAMLRLILAEKLYDADFVAANTRGIEALRQAVQPFTLDYAAQRAGVPAHEIAKAARIFAGARRGMANAGTGPNMAPRGNLTEYLLLCLNTLCGRWMRAGEAIPNPGVLLPPTQAIAQPADPRPGWGFGEKLRVRNFSNTAAGLPTAALAEEILEEGPGRVRALFSIGGNPVAAWPDQQKTLRAMGALDLNVTLDIKWSATARTAHYVIAPKLGLEVPGMSLPPESLTPYAMGYAVPWGQYSPAIAEPPAGSDLIEDWQLFYRLAQRMQLPLRIFAAYSWGPEFEQPAHLDLDMQREPTTDALFEAITQGSRIALSEVKRHPHGALFPDPEARVRPRDPACTARLELGDSTMLAELSDVAAESVAANSRFRFQLVSRRLPDVHNSAGRDIAKLTRRWRYNPAFMNPADLAALGLTTGDAVEIDSGYASIAGIVESAPDVRTGIVSMAHAFGDTPDREQDPRAVGSNTGRLSPVDRDYDPYSGIPRMSAIPVEVRPLAARN
jgi:anaerobic selenocysteine-containing dehydrogenase